MPIEAPLSERLAVVVPTYNRVETTLQFIRRLNAQSHPLTIYVSDSESSDGTCEAVAGEPNVVVVRAGATAWWSAAVNRGIEHALADGVSVILVMNDDVAFDTQTISMLLEKHRSNPRNIISSFQHTPGGEFAGTLYPGVFRRVKHLGHVQHDTIVDSSNGCCLLIPSEVIAVAGKFDEKNCPHLYGDTEFQLRALRCGYPTMVSPDIKIWQMAPTNYFSRLKAGSLFTFEGSPLHWRAYTTFGKRLYGGPLRFAFFGIFFHIGFVKVLIKTMVFFVKRKIQFC